MIATVATYVAQIDALLADMIEGRISVARFQEAHYALWLEIECEGPHVHRSVMQALRERTRAMRAVEEARR